MKIVIVNQHPHDVLGGSEIQCDIIATHLTHFGHEVVYLAVNGKSTSYDTPYSVISVDISKPLAFYRILKKTQPDVVYWRHNKKALLSSAIAIKLCEIRFIYSISHVNDIKPFVLSGSGTVFMRFRDSIRSRSTVFDAIRSGAFLLDPVRSAVNYAAVPILADGIVSLNVNYLPNSRTKPKIAIHNSMPIAASGFEWPRPYIVWVASIKRKKNPEKYYQLAQSLEDEVVDLLMVGPITDDSYAYLATAGKELSNFYYLGPKSVIEVNGILKNALFLVHTCDPEGFGNNFIQAWLQGKPTISLYFDPEGIIEKEGLGYYSRTFARFEEHTRQLIADEQIRRSMGQRAREFARQHFDPEINVRRLEHFLLSLLSE